MEEQSILHPKQLRHITMGFYIQKSPSFALKPDLRVCQTQLPTFSPCIKTPKQPKHPNPPKPSCTRPGAATMQCQEPPKKPLDTPERSRKIPKAEGEGRLKGEEILLNYKPLLLSASFMHGTSIMEQESAATRRLPARMRMEGQ